MEFFLSINVQITLCSFQLVNQPCKSEINPSYHDYHFVGFNLGKFGKNFLSMLLRDTGL